MKKCPQNGQILLKEVVFIQNNNKYTKAKSLLGVLFFFRLRATLSVNFQLEEHIIRLREELDREREEKSYFQLERDKIRAFWEICKRHLEETRAELRNREREGEEAEERHRVEITVSRTNTVQRVANAFGHSEMLEIVHKLKSQRV